MEIEWILLVFCCINNIVPVLCYVSCVVCGMVGAAAAQKKSSEEEEEEDNNL
jgi:hypothetical protein